LAKQDWAHQSCPLCEGLAERSSRAPHVRGRLSSWLPDNVFNQGEVAKIEQYIKQLKATPEKELITVVDHTDASGSDKYNFALGLKRVKAVRDYIISRGYPADNVAASESQGESELFPSFDPLSVEQRRVTLTKAKLFARTKF